MFNTKKGAKSTDLPSSLSKKIITFATLSGLLERKSRSFKPDVFLLALMRVSQQGKASLNKIAMEMAQIDSKCLLSPQALHKRINKGGCALEVFLHQCIGAIISEGVQESHQYSKHFGRILTEDSSFVRMLKSCADLFPAHGNKHGATAGMKLNLVFDLLSGAPIECATHSGTMQDRTIAWDVLSLVKPGDLILRDMGYFCVEIFERIEAKTAHWLSRIPSGVEIYTDEGRKIEDLMKRSKSGLIDREMQLTDQGKVARVVAVKKSQQKADESLRELKEEYRKKGKTPPKRRIIRAQWHIIATSVEKKIITLQKLTKLYAQRWQIEITFKAWKQSSNMQKSLSHKSSYAHLIGMFLVEVLRLSLALKIYFYARKRLSDDKVGMLSLMKLFDYLSTKINSAKSLRNLVSNILCEKHIFTQKRRRKPQLHILLECLG